MSSTGDQQHRKRLSGASIRLRRSPPEDDGDGDAIHVLRLGAALGIVFLIAYAAFDLRGHPPSFSAAGSHALAVAGTCLFFAATWTRTFRRSWKLWTLAICTFLMVMFVVISSRTGDPESRFIAIILCPLATASFVSWGPRWQLALNAIAIAIFAVAGMAVPIARDYQFYRWMGLAAALSFAQGTAVFIERYRLRIRAQIEALDEAARFRELQVATMAHDIRSPVATLAGYAGLLEDGVGIPEAQRTLLNRIGSTAWNMSLVVGNVLDLYRLEEDGGFARNASAVDHNDALAETAEDCALQARRMGARMQCVIDRLPALAIDSHHLDSIVRNLCAWGLERADGAPLRLSARCDGASASIAVESPRAKLKPRDLEALTAPSGSNSRPQGADAIGIHLVRAMAEAAGGRTVARIADADGFSIGVEIPIFAAETSR